MDGKRESANLVLNGEFTQGLSVGWIEKSVQPFPDPASLSDEYKALGDGTARMVMTDGLPSLEITHEGRGATRVYQDIPVDTVPTYFSGDFRFHLVDTWGHASLLAFVELAFCDNVGNVLGRHVWYYGAWRPDWGIQADSPTSSKTDLRGEQVPFGELKSDWLSCKLDISKAMSETLTAIDQAKVKTMRITLDCRTDAKKGYLKMWARHIVLR